MGTQPSLPRDRDPAPNDAPEAPRLPQPHRAALSAPAPGPKASHVDGKRKQRIDERAATESEEWHIASQDGALSYAVRAVDSGLYVERRQRRPLGADVVQSMVFASVDEFTRWCDAEPLRFDDPVAHRTLRQHGEEFFSARG